MMLHRIFIVRHAETADDGNEDLIWAGKGGLQHGPMQQEDAPTNNFADKKLSIRGEQQAIETRAALADLTTEPNLPITVVYSSPSYQCLRTLESIVGNNYEVRVENGFRNWQDIEDVQGLCPSLCNHESPTSLKVLRKHFPVVDSSYESIVTKPPRGWSIERPQSLLLRAHFTMEHIIKELDHVGSITGQPQTVLICTHAPLVIALSRILTANEFPVQKDHWSRDDTGYPGYLSLLKDKIRRIVKYRFYYDDHDAGNCCITQLDRSSQAKWAWRMKMDGSNRHTGPVKPWVFRPTIWQNRLAPNPVRAAMEFRLHHVPEHIMFWMRELGNMFCSLRRAQRKNPYRTPSWIWFVYLLGILLGLGCKVVLLCILLFKIQNHLDLEKKEWEFLLDASSSICLTLPIVIVFMFPPIIRA